MNLRRTLPLLLVLAASPFLTHCGQGGCKGPLETPDPSWTPKLVYSYENLKPFQSSKYPMADYPALAWSFQLESPRDMYDPLVVETAPDRIRLEFWVTYSAAAIRQWRKDGYIAGGDTAAQWGIFHYTLRLDSTALEKGEYAFNAADTSEGLHPEMTFALGPSDGQSAPPVLASAPFSGYLRIEKRFTHKEGKFSFRLEARHAPNQVTVLASSVVFAGYEKNLNCGWH